jgi:hypothetical protein
VARDYNMPCIVAASALDLTTLVSGSRMRMHGSGSIDIWRD